MNGTCISVVEHVLPEARPHAAGADRVQQQQNPTQKSPEREQFLIKDEIGKVCFFPRQLQVLLVLERGPGRGLTSSIFWVSFKYYQKNQSLDSFPLPIANFTWMLHLDAAPIASAIPAEMPGSREPLRPLPSGCHPTDPPWNPRGC